MLSEFFNLFYLSESENCIRHHSLYHYLAAIGKEKDFFPYDFDDFEYFSTDAFMRCCDLLLNCSTHLEALQTFYAALLPQREDYYTMPRPYRLPELSIKHYSISEDILDFKDIEEASCDNLDKFEDDCKRIRKDFFYYGYFRNEGGFEDFYINHLSAFDEALNLALSNYFYPLSSTNELAWMEEEAEAKAKAKAKAEAKAAAEEERRRRQELLDDDDDYDF